MKSTRGGRRGWTPDDTGDQEAHSGVRRARMHPQKSSDASSDGFPDMQSRPRGPHRQEASDRSSGVGPPGEPLGTELVGPSPGTSRPTKSGVGAPMASGEAWAPDAVTGGSGRSPCWAGEPHGTGRLAWCRPDPLGWEARRRLGWFWHRPFSWSYPGNGGRCTRRPWGTGRVRPGPAGVHYSARTTAVSRETRPTSAGHARSPGPEAAGREPMSAARALGRAGHWAGPQDSPEVCGTLGGDSGPFARVAPRPPVRWPPPPPPAPLGATELAGPPLAVALPHSFGGTGGRSDRWPTSPPAV